MIIKKNKKGFSIWNNNKQVALFIGNYSGYFTFYDKNGNQRVFPSIAKKIKKYYSDMFVKYNADI